MKILVTGCAGFIGFHLTRRLLDKGHSVVGVDNLNDYYTPELKAARLRELGVDTQKTEYNVPFAAENLVFIHADIEDADLYGMHLDAQKFDIVCHLAAQAGVRYSIDNPAQYVSSNLVGFFKILEYCRHNPVRRLVYASSSSVYGDNDSIPYRENDCTDKPRSFYGATKKANEVIAHSYSSLYNMEAVGLRFFTVYGPWGRPDMAPFLFTHAVLEGRPIDVFNEGRMMRDFTYVDDIVEGVCRVLLNKPRNPSPERHRIYNIGNSQPVGLGDFIAMIERLTGREAQKRYLPMQPGDVTRTWADTTRLREDYGYAPSTPLEDGLAAFVRWYHIYFNT